MALGATDELNRAGCRGRLSALGSRPPRSGALRILRAAVLQYIKWPLSPLKHWTAVNERLS
jgi:hypothetical protein